MNMRRFTCFTTAAITLALCTPLLAAQPPNAPAPSAEPLSANVRLLDSANRNCQLPVEGNGHWAINRACDYTPDHVLVEAMPSQSTLLISQSDCTESVSSSAWWVKIQATSLVTSSTNLPVSNILSDASRWIANPSDSLYIAPNLKIVGAQVRDQSASTIRCALLQLPVLQRADVMNLSPRPWIGFKENQNAQCADGVLIATYSRRAGEFEYQCANLLDASRAPYTAYDVSTVSMSTGDTARSCPGRKVVTGLKLDSSYGGEFFRGATLTCAYFKNASGAVTLAASGPESSSRWISYKEHHNTCERPGYPASDYLLTPPNGVMTGLDVASQETKWYCSELTRR
jgi:hypothetical protein